MASRRDQIKMTSAEVADFLGEGHTLQTATINADGTPHLVAMFYCLVDGDIAYWTYGQSQKIKNLQRDPRLTVMCEAGGHDYNALRGVTIHGTAELSTDPGLKQQVGRGVYERYFGEWNDEAAAGVEYAGAKRTVVRITADKTLSWDHRKIQGY